ncbi:hypothetical protein ACLB2K_020458 [Fragaria x ananassa]
MTASDTSMTARLISKLSLSNQEEPFPKKGFIAPRFYLVGKLNTARAMPFESFRSVIRSMWRLSSQEDVQAREDRYLFTFSNERDVIRVMKGGPWVIRGRCFLSTTMMASQTSEKSRLSLYGSSASLKTATIAPLVVETIGPVL